MLFSAASPLRGALIGLALLTACLALTGCDNNALGADKIPEKERVLPMPGDDKPDAASRQSENKPDTRNTPRTATVGVPSEADIGLTFYPGAKPVQGLNGPLAASKNYGTYLAILATGDPMDKVVAFYKGLYPATKPLKEFPKANPNEIKLPRRTEWTDEGQEETRLVRCSLFDPAAGNGLRSIQISPKEGKTRIELMRIEVELKSTEPLPQSPVALPSELPPAPLRPAPFDSSTPDGTLPNR